MKSISIITLFSLSLTGSMTASGFGGPDLDPDEYCFAVTDRQLEQCKAMKGTLINTHTDDIVKYCDLELPVIAFSRGDSFGHAVCFYRGAPRTKIKFGK